MEGPEPGCHRSGLETLRAHAGQACEARQSAPGRRQGRRADRAARAHAARRQIRAAATAARSAVAPQVELQAASPAREITSSKNLLRLRLLRARGQQEEALKPQLALQYV